MATYGHEVKSSDDNFIQLVEHATNMTVGVGPPGGMPVDFLPFCEFCLRLTTGHEFN